jgi:adenylate kinase
MLGIPGSGKGTQSKLVAAKYGLQHYSTGDIFREVLKTGSELATRIKSYVEKGLLVPDNIVVEVVEQRLGSNNDNYILDGMPRNIAQAEQLDGFLINQDKKVNYVLYLELPFDIAIQRLTSRRMCPQCNGNYNLLTQPPAKDESCDKCGVRLIQRVDDKEETVKKRIQVYESETAPLVDYYAKQSRLTTINVNKPPAQIFSEICSVIDRTN